MDQMTFLLERLRPVIERMGGGGFDGEDLYGDVCLACSEKWDRYDWSHSKIEGRIMCMAKNLRVKRFRRERLRKYMHLPSDDCRTLTYEVGSVEERKVLLCMRCRDAIDSLPDRYRQVIHEHFINGKRLVAIAWAMNLPSATIRTHCRRALQQLARDPGIRELAPSDGVQP